MNQIFPPSDHTLLLRPSKKHQNNAKGLHSLCIWIFILGYDNVNLDAFVKAMERYGFEGVDAFDIVKTGKEVREELAAIDSEKAAGLWVNDSDFNFEIWRVIFKILFFS